MPESVGIKGDFDELHYAYSSHIVASTINK